MTVENLLRDKKVTYLEKGKDLLVKCFNPDHEDTNPSLRIDKEGGDFHCFGCGYKGNIFLFFNKTKNVINQRIKKTKDKVVELRKASWAGLSLPIDAFFVAENFGNIPAATLQQFQAFRTSDFGMDGRIVFPIYDASNRIVAFQGRYIFTDAPPKYLVYPKEVVLPWFPNQFKVEPINGTIILVEGIRDALVLHSKGITNAICIFGTKSVSYENIVSHLNPYLLKGVQKVVLLMDGDAAGLAASSHLEKCITRKTDLEVTIVSLAEGTDPASMSDYEIATLTKVYK